MAKVFIFLTVVCFVARFIEANPANLRRAASQVTQMPLNDIVPILQCIDKNNKAYFSYQNNAGGNVTLGLSDLNRLTPLDIAPITFFVNGSGPAFPFSPQIALAAFENSTFNWDLEYYYLMFNITPELACPKKFNLTITVIYDTVSYFDWQTAIVNAFANVTQISPTRINVQNVQYLVPAKRSGLGSTVILEMELDDGNSTNPAEPTAAEVVQNVVENQQQELNQTLQQQYNLGNSQLTGLTPKSDPTPSINGQVRPPTSVPVEEPISDVPTSAVPVASPKPKSTLSSASIFSVNTIVGTAFLILCSIAVL